MPRDVAYYFGELSQIGILIFFAISGFVITSSIQRRTSGDFLWLRFLRIYPGFWLAIVIAVLLQLAVFGTSAWAPRFVNALTQSPWSAVPGSLGGGGWTLIYVVLFCVLVAVLWFTRSLRVIAQYRAFRIASALAILIPLLVLGSSAGNARVIKTLTLLPLGVMPRPLGGVEWTLVYEVFFYLLIAMLWMTRSNRVVGGFCALWAITIAAARWSGRPGAAASRRRSRESDSPPTTSRSSAACSRISYTNGSISASRVPSRCSCPDSPSAASSSRGPSGSCLCRRRGLLSRRGGGAVRARKRRGARRPAHPMGRRVLRPLPDPQRGDCRLQFGDRRAPGALAVGMVGLFGLGMGAGLLYGALEHRLYGVLKARFGRPPWRVPAPRSSALRVR